MYRVLSLLFLLMVPSFVVAKEQIIIGVLAKRGSSLTLQRWLPTAEYLHDKIPQYDFTIKPLTFDDIHRCVKNREVDFILANSGFYVDLEYEYQVQRIATLVNKHISGLSEKEFGGVIFTHIDNKKLFKSIRDIQGKSFIAVNERSLGGWQMAWRELKKAGINPFSDLKSLEFKGTHDQIVYDILAKKAQVGTVRSDTLERMAMEGKIKLEDFYIVNQQHYPDFPFLISTRLYPEWPFAKLKHISDDLSKKVAIALMTMRSDDKAAVVGKITSWSTPMDYNPVHECFKELKLPPYNKSITLLDVVKNYGGWILFFIVLALGAVSMILYQLRLTNYLRDTQDELVQTEKMASLGRLVAGISHEINTPLGIGITASSHLEKETKQIKKVFEQDQIKKSELVAYFDSALLSSSMILQNLLRASQLIESFKQISVDQTSNDIREFILYDYLQSIVLSLKPMMKNTRHRIDIFCEKAIKIQSNPGALSQIFTNLLINSYLHGFESLEEGHIVIEVIALPRKLIFLYKDNGKGIKASEMTKHFDPFYTTKRNGGGSGLGTHIIYNLVTQKLLGTIAVTSVPNKGISYTIELDEKGFNYA